MPDHITKREQQRGTRNLFVGAAVIAAVLLVAIGLWPLLSRNETGDSERASVAGGGGAQSAAGQKSNQDQGESNTGAAAPNRPDDPTGGKARSIQHSAKDVSLLEEERQQLRSYFSAHAAARANDVNFSIAIGSAVPRGQELKPTPDEVVSLLKGYQGSDYLLIRDQLVIVDRQARRVVAIIPGIGA